MQADAFGQKLGIVLVTDICRKIAKSWGLSTKIWAWSNLPQKLWLTSNSTNSTSTETSSETENDAFDIQLSKRAMSVRLFQTKKNHLCTCEEANEEDSLFVRGWPGLSLYLFMCLIVAEKLICWFLNESNPSTLTLSLTYATCFLSYGCAMFLNILWNVLTPCLFQSCLEI